MTAYRSLPTSSPPNPSHRLLLLLLCPDSTLESSNHSGLNPRIQPLASKVPPSVAAAPQRNFGDKAPAAPLADWTSRSVTNTSSPKPSCMYVMRLLPFALALSPELSTRGTHNVRKNTPVHCKSCCVASDGSLLSVKGKVRLLLRTSRRMGAGATMQAIAPPAVAAASPRRSVRIGDLRTVGGGVEAMMLTRDCDLKELRSISANVLLCDAFDNGFP